MNNENLKKELETENQTQPKEVTATEGGAQLKMSKDEVVKKFIEENTKTISLTKLTPEQKTKIEWTIKELLNVEKEIEEKKSLFVKTNAELDHKLTILARDGKIRLDEQDYKKEQDRLKRNENIFEKILKDIEQDLSFFQSLVCDNPPATIEVFMAKSEDSNVFVEEKILTTKKFIKNIGKELRVSYSQHMYSVQSQLRRLEYLELLLAREAAKKNKK